MQPWDALDEARATIIARRYWRSRAENAPSDSMDHLDLFVERHRLHDLCGSRVWILRRIHPRLRRLHAVCLLLRRQPGSQQQAQCSQPDDPANQHDSPSSDHQFITKRSGDEG
jgi:hypothetical protein